MKNIIIVTEDWSGLGFAIPGKNETNNLIIAYKPSEEEDHIRNFNLVGRDLVNRMPLEAALKEYKGKGAYWIFDQNHLSDVSENLRKSGEKVWGASEFMGRMEKDRKYASDIAHKSGLSIPESEEFSDIKAGMDFIDQNPEKAYVFKPDDSDDAHLTFVPSLDKDTEANRELFHYLASMSENVNTFILQERKKGVETNYEIWFYQGQPFFAFCNFENKRKLNRDLGENVGCAQDIGFVVPLNSKGVRETIGKLIPFYQKMKYTGFADVNVIVGDKEVWFLEVCNRFGYNSHPNLFNTLALDSFGDIMSAAMDGEINDFYSHFKEGFGASIMLNIDHPRRGLPVTIKEELKGSFHPFDLYKEGEVLLTAGYYDIYIGVVTNHDYTIEDAGEGCVNKIFILEQISYPDIGYRSDLYKTDYPTAPIKRYRALEAMGFMK